MMILISNHHILKLISSESEGCLSEGLKLFLVASPLPLSAPVKGGSDCFSLSFDFKNTDVSR